MTEASAEPFRTSTSRRSLISNASRHHPTVVSLEAIFDVVPEEATDGSRDQ